MLGATRWRRLFEAADHALDLDPNEREAFLMQCRTDDPAFGEELQDFLLSAERVTALEVPAAEFAPVFDDRSALADPGADATTRFGPYRILEEIGRGGMGAVYLAERSDDQFQKRVALKLLPGRSARDERRVQRFVEERHILAALDHPDIARLLDGGLTADGVPWFAMEYVEGVPIDRYCDDARLPIEERLELFCRVCAAVQYAHRNLVVHRDLKPANILVTRDGRVRLLDFGIAKLLVSQPGIRPELTATDERVLTPLYASPEQIRGDAISTGSDVYSLGVLLYALLTGRYPYRLSSWQHHEVARAVLERDAEPPSLAVLHGATTPVDGETRSPADTATVRRTTSEKLRRRLRGDLDAIVLRALEKLPSRRYLTTEQLEADVRNHLAGLPVTAQRAGRLYLARKFLRRHRLSVAAAATFVLLLMGFALAMAVQSSRIRAQAARIALERDGTRAVLDYVTNVIKQAIPNRPGRGVTGLDVLDTATARINRGLVQQPEARAHLMLSFARQYLQIDSAERARRLLDTSLALQRAYPTGDDRDLAETLHLLGEARLARGELGEAERAYREALALRRGLFGDRDAHVARTLNGLSRVYRLQNHVPDARVAAAEALSIDNASGGMGTDVVESLQSLAGARLDLGDSVEARTLYRRALETLRTRVPEPSPIVIVATIDLASALEGGSARERVEADSLIRHVLTLERRLLWEGDVLSRDLLAELRLQRPRLAPVSPASGRIAFVSDRDGPDPVGNMGNQEIYIMNPDGSGQQRLTHNGATETAPALSPDGRMIAFMSNRSGAPELYVMNVDGNGERQLKVPGAGGDMGARQPRWSPDGKQIVFFSSVRPDIYVINLDGTGLKNLTDHPGADICPDWSPDGRRIAFTSNRDGAREIYVMNADGTNVARLTSGLKGNVGMWLRPRWSPDGRKIAFATDRDRTDGTSEIYVMNADGSNLVRLTFNDVLDAEPTWSPDGKMIAFHRTVLDHVQVFVMQADGSNQTRITELSGVSFSGFPSWGRRPSPQR